MRKRLSLILAALLFVALSIQSDAILRHSVATAQNKTVPAPEDVLGFRPGDDRKLASWAKVVEYFQKLSAASDRVRFEEIGKSTMGRPFVYATISAPENLARLEEFKDIQRRLADPRLLGEIADIEPGRKGSKTFKLKKGSYTLFCNLPGHYAGGMKATLVVGA